MYQAELPGISKENVQSALHALRPGPTIEIPGAEIYPREQHKWYIINLTALLRHSLLEDQNSRSHKAREATHRY